MYKVQFEVISGSEITIYFSNTLTVINSKVDKNVKILDGLHNNGGWTINESYETVIAKIDAAMKNN